MGYSRFHLRASTSQPFVRVSYNHVRRRAHRTEPPGLSTSGGGHADFTASLPLLPFPCTAIPGCLRRQRWVLHPSYSRGRRAVQPARPIASASTTRRMDVGPKISCLVGRYGVLSLRPRPRGPRIVSTARTARCPRDRSRSRATSSKIRSLHTAPPPTRVVCGHVPSGDRPTVSRCCFPLPSCSRRGRHESL